jgi:metallo-beta-lactamase class B
MKRTLFLCLIFALCGIPAESQIIQLNEELTIQPVESDVWVVIHRFPWEANSLLVRSDSSEFVLVDTPWENEASRLVYEWLHDTFHNVNLLVIDTHFHRDNLGGNGFFLQHGVPVYGSDLTVQLLAKQETDATLLAVQDRPEYQRYAAVFRQTELLPPDHVFPISEGLTLQIGSDSLEIYYPGPAHSPDNVVVYFPKRRILFGGCMVKSLDSRTLGSLVAADVKAWPHSLRNLLNRYPDSRIVIPGHGGRGDLALIHHTLHLLDAGATGQ